METFTQADKYAWAAGFFEGEGAFFASYRRPLADGSRRIHPGANLVQKERALLERFASILGFGRINGRDAKGCYVWRTNANGDVAHLVEYFGPWLSERRRQRAEELVAAQQKQVDRRTLGPWNKGRRMVAPNEDKRIKENGHVYPAAA